MSFYPVLYADEEFRNHYPFIKSAVFADGLPLLHRTGLNNYRSQVEIDGAQITA